MRNAAISELSARHAVSEFPVIPEVVREVVPEGTVSSPQVGASCLEVVAVEVLEEPLLVAEPQSGIPTAIPPGTPNRPTVQRKRIQSIGGLIGSAGEWLFGAVALIVGLSFLAAYPVVQLLSLGYLLEASGRIARTGHLSAGFVGIRKAARIGSLVLGAWLLILPLRLVSSLASSARLIEPHSPADRGWSVALAVLTLLTVLHIVGACWRGGRLRHFLWPAPIRTVRLIFSRGAYGRARDAVWNYATGLRLSYYFWLGLRGFVGGMIWLAVPITMIAAGRQAPLVGFLGAVGLVVVVLYLPFVQTQFAADNRLRAMFELGRVRQVYRRGPIAFLVALVATLLFAIPLYLLKIEIVPREAAWLPSLVFVVFMYPARLLTGWAYGYASHREAPRHWLIRQGCRLIMLPAVAFYVLIVFFTQYTSWHGVGSLYEQHAFLVPVPFFWQ